jgi:hypothetical protein
MREAIAAEDVAIVEKKTFERMKEKDWKYV